MASEHFHPNSTTVDAPYLQPPPGRQFVRSFLFSRRVNAPLAQIHLLARILLVLCLSATQLRTINTDHPDLAGATALWLLSVVLFACSGMHARTARLYILLTIPTLLSLFLTWTLLNPIAGRVTLIYQPFYSGYMNIGVALWEVLWLAIVVAYFWWKRGVLLGIIIASAAAILVTSIIPLPAWTLTRVVFFHPLTIIISDRALLVATTKTIGYSGMILSTIALVVTSRDTELTGTLRQLHIPNVVIFFLSTVFRALNLALSDYETIYQAQIARAINARPRSFFRRLRDLGSIAVPMVAMMIRRSSEIGDALLARGYTLGQSHANFFETSPWRLVDWIVLLISLILLYLALVPHTELTTILLLAQNTQGGVFYYIAHYFSALQV